MSNMDYIRNASDKCGWKRYYLLERPVNIGTVPKSGMMDFINYDDKTEMQTNDGVIRVWAEIYYDRELTKKEMNDYEIVRG